MEEKKGIIQRVLGAAKSAVFEKGDMIYCMNIPAFRSSRKKIEARPRKQKIRIGFMIQCPQNWAVLQSVYQTALRDEQIEPVVLLIPEMEFAYYVILKDVIWEKTYEFGEKVIGSKAIRTYNPETKEWLDPKTLDLDYVFIPRPYETYLPKAYRASFMRKMAKVCYVPYAFPTLSDWEILYNTHFIRNVSMIFCEKKSSDDYVRNKLRKTIQSGDQKVFLCGYPKFDLISSHEGNQSSLWPRERMKGVFRFLWTPRWTTDPKMGGSNFFKYKDQMISWAEEDLSIDLLFRPHPLALEHYISAGLMTEEEQKDYLNRYQKCINANVDRTTEYYDTFYSSDFLVTDISSMIMDYLFTGKPIIFCKSSDDSQISVPELHECLYKAGSFDELVQIANELMKGNDPKKELRMKLVNQLKPEETAAVHILREVKADYFRK